MIIKKIEIDGQMVKFAASASIPRIYRRTFHRDIIIDMQKLSDDIQELGRSEEDSPSSLPVQTIEIFENVSYVMAKHADQSIPDTVDDWLDQFNTFSIYSVLPELLNLWGMNNQTLSIPKKK